jgi:hypothetical protein
MNDILYQFIEGQAHYGMPECFQTSLVLNEPKWVTFFQMYALPLSMHRKWKGIIVFLHTTTNGKS